MKKKISEECYKDIKLLVYDLLEIELSVPEYEVEQELIDNWSSLKHLSLIMEIESKFKIKFRIEEVLKMNTFEIIVEKIEQQLSKA